MITVDRSYLARPRTLNYQITRSLALYLLPLFIQQSGLDPKIGEARITRFHGVCGWHWGNHHRARLCLPPAVNYRAATVTHHAVIPLPGFRVDWFANGSDDS